MIIFKKLQSLNCFLS